MRFQSQYSAEDRAREAERIDLTGMDPKTEALVRAQWRQLKRADNLNFTTAFEVINKYEATPLMREWSKKRAEWKNFLTKHRPAPSHAREFLDLPKRP